MKELFIAIQEHLIAAVPELKMIDFDLGQLEVEPLPSLSYPAALISFVDSDFLDLGAGKQQADVNINISFIFRTFERTHSIAKTQYRAVGLKHLDIVDKAKWALHGLTGDNFNPISHRSFATTSRADLRVYLLSFTTLLTVEPPNNHTLNKFIKWTEGGGTPPGPDLCLTDEENQPLE